MFDLVLKGGKIVDGTGNPWYTGDVGIREGRIAKIGLIPGDQGKTTINVEGLVVSPGFIDIHSHADFILPLENHLDILESFLKQGITTLVTGNCGLSPFPVNPESLGLLKGYTEFFQGGELTWDWLTTEDFLDRLDSSGTSFNVIPLVSHGAVRIAVMGFAGDTPTLQQLEEMKKLVAQAMADGAFGLSAGLIYAPGMFASTAELIEVTRPLIPYRGVFTCHVRGSSETVLEATREIIEIARVNRIPVEHSHIEAFGEQYWHRIDEVIALHESARAEGLDVTFDVIPYTAANTTLTACFPSYAFEGGLDMFIARLKDPAERERIRHDVENMRSEWPTWRPGTWPHNLVRATGWQNIWLIWVASEKNAGFIGKSFAEIGRMQGKTPFDAAADLLIEERGAALALYVGVSGDLENEEGLKKFLAHPNGAINTDAILTGRGMPHPAAYGSFPRVLGRYVREQKLLSLEQAIRKMTSLSAQRFGIHDRGLIKPGMWADITIFNEQTIRDNATYLEPDREPDGIEYVLVNGQLVVEQGKVNKSVRTGKVLRRQ
ncbi:MAG: D-aminoacylase [Bacillota bacterium]